VIHSKSLKGFDSFTHSASFITISSNEKLLLSLRGLKQHPSNGSDKIGTIGGFWLRRRAQLVFLKNKWLFISAAPDRAPNRLCSSFIKRDFINDLQADEMCENGCSGNEGFTLMIFKNVALRLDALKGVVPY
jgi:hypothetical protein